MYVVCFIVVQSVNRSQVSILTLTLVLLLMKVLQ